MSGNNGQERRFVYTPEDLVFYTDTDDYDYPLYILPDRQVVYKRQPEGERVLATFHVKSVSSVEAIKVKQRGLDYYSSRLNVSFFSFNLPVVALDDAEAKYSIKIKDVVDAMKSLSDEVFAVVREVTYEAYRGDYDEHIGDASANILFLYLVPPYTTKMEKKQRWGITYSTLKRLKTKYSGVIAPYERYLYIKSSKNGDRPYIVIKIPLVSEELKQVFQAALTAEVAEEVEEVAEEPQAAEESALPVPLPEPALPELEVEFEQPVHIPPAAEERTAVQPTPPAGAEAPACTPPAEGVERAELVKVYFLSMRLPSRYLVQTVRVERGKGVLREVRVWEGEGAELAAKLETLRRRCYESISRVFAIVPELGVWVAVTEEAFAEAARLGGYIREELTRLGLDGSRYAVRAVPVYLEPEDAREVLEAAVRHLSADVEELQKRIEEAEKAQNRKALQRLMKDMNYRKALLDAFREYLARLGGA